MADKYLILAETLTSLADKVRNLHGSTEQMSLNDIQNAIQEEYDSIQNAIESLEAKGVSVPEGTTASGLADLIAVVETGIKTDDATATEADLIDGKTAYARGILITGTIANNGTIAETMDGIQTKTISIPEGYTSGGSVSLTDDIDNAVTEQASIMDQIKTVLQEKAGN